MDLRTQNALLAVNRRFYERHGASFSATRQFAWPGWPHLLPHLPQVAPTPLAVLDVGCGNGRFARFLATQVKAPWTYLGLDSSPLLLAQAQELPLPLQLRLVDLIADPLSAVLGEQRFHWIALFGVLHHLPGRANRQRLLVDLAHHLARPGILTLSIWRFDQDPRAPQKRLSWERYNTTAGERIALDQLEPGDQLLTWAGDPDTPRFCHLADEGEVVHWQALLGQQELSLRERFAADGRTGAENSYLVFAAEPL
jgi:tRNA (uracil-5-)-methyltransferase TRM9